jgi:molybdate transport system substrate-binding protein
MQLSGISSMATKALLTDLTALASQHPGVEVRMQSVGGVDAAKRVQAGEAFDVIFLASDAIAKLEAEGHVLANSAVHLVHSEVAMAIPAGRTRPSVRNEEDLRELVASVSKLSYSTGPSGVALAKMFERWGLAESLAARIVTPPPGVPVASLVAKGEVDLGFQQTSEMLHVAGIELLGPLPADVAITTTFTAAIGAHSQPVEQVRALLAFWASPACDAAKRAQGMRAA